jgi:hypothetical protein
LKKPLLNIVSIRLLDVLEAKVIDWNGNIWYDFGKQNIV